MRIRLEAKGDETMSKRTAGDDYTTARAVAEAMIGKCGLSQSLGMKIIDAGPKYSVVEMVLEDRHLNGFSIAHGGAIFALADTAFAHACNSDNVVTVAQQCQINFLQPGRAGDLLTATAKGRTHSGRTGIYDVTVTGSDDGVIAEFRGMSCKLRDPVIPDAG